MSIFLMFSLAKLRRDFFIRNFIFSDFILALRCNWLILKGGGKIRISDFSFGVSELIIGVLARLGIRAEKVSPIGLKNSMGDEIV